MSLIPDLYRDDGTFFFDRRDDRRWRRKFGRDDVWGTQKICRRQKRNPGFGEINKIIIHVYILH